MVIKHCRKKFSGFETIDFIFPTKEEAEDAFDFIDNVLDKYGMISIGALFEHMDILVTDVSLYKYGLTNIQKVWVEEDMHGYRLHCTIEHKEEGNV